MCKLCLSLQRENKQIQTQMETENKIISTLITSEYEDGNVSAAVLFNERTRRIMSQKGWTRLQLAEKLGVSSASLMLNRNGASPSVSLMMRYAEALGVQAWDLIYDCGVSAVGVSGEAAPLKWNTPEELNQRIARMMRANGVTQQQAADRMGVLRESVTNYLRSKNMSLVTLMRLAKGLGVEPWELLIDREDMEREVARRRNGGRMPEEVGAAEVVQPVQQEGASVKENVQQMQIKTDGKASGTVAEDTLPWDEEVLEARKASEADKRLSAIPLRVIRIIRCPYCQHEIEINDK